MSRETSSPGFDPEAPTAEALAQVELRKKTVKVIETVRKKGADSRDEKPRELHWVDVSKPYKVTYDLLPDGSSQKESMLLSLQKLERLASQMKALLTAYLPEEKAEQLDLELLANSKPYRAALEEEFDTLPSEVDEYVRTVHQLNQFSQDIEQQQVAQGLASPAAVPETVAPSGEHELSYVAEDWQEPRQDVVDAEQLAALRSELAKDREPLPVNDITVQALEGMIEEVRRMTNKAERQQQITDLEKQAAKMMSTLGKEDVGNPLYERLLDAQTELAALSE